MNFKQLPGLPNGHSQKLELEQIKVNELYVQAKKTRFLKYLSVEFFDHNDMKDVALSV